MNSLPVTYVWDNNRKAALPLKEKAALLYVTFRYHTYKLQAHHARKFPRKKSTEAN